MTALDDDHLRPRTIHATWGQLQTLETEALRAWWRQLGSDPKQLDRKWLINGLIQRGAKWLATPAT